MSTHTHVIHAAYTSTATPGAGRPTIRFNDIAEMVTGFFRVSRAKDVPVVELERIGEDMATILRVWLGYTPVRKRARAVNRVVRRLCLNMGARTYSKQLSSCLGSSHDPPSSAREPSIKWQVLPRSSVGRLAQLKKHLLFAVRLLE